jgi:O-antigen ligase/tetratricopeptide (TPR) repeat protein
MKNIAQGAQKNPVLWRTLRRLAQTAVILLTLYMVLLGGFVTGLREYRWRLITLVLLTVLFGGWLLIRWFRDAPLRTGLELPLLLMLAASLLSTVASTDPRLSAGRLALNIILALSFYLTLDWLRDRWRANMLTNSLLLVGFVIIIVGLVEYWQWLNGNLIAPVSWSEGELAWNFNQSLRIKSVLHNPNYLAYFLLAPIALVTVKLFTVERNIWRVGWVMYLLVALLTMFLTRSRGGLLGTITLLVVASALMGWSRWGGGRLKIRRGPEFWALMVVTLLAVMALLIPLTGRGTGFNQRDNIWQGGLNIFWNYPLFGAGPATFPTQYFVYRTLDGLTAIFTHAHNVWLTIAAEYGLLGVGAVLLFFVALVVKVVRYLRKTAPAQWSPLLVSGVALLTGQSMHNLVDDFMEFPIFSWLTVLGVALCLAPMVLPPLSGWQRRLWLGAVTFSTFCLLLFSVWYGRAFAAYDRARLASQQGDWVTAAQQLERAIDIDPAFRFYRQQLALAYGELARSEPAYAARALALQEQVYPTSHYPPDAAYLGCLYWQLDRPEQALVLMRAAADTTPAIDGGFFSYHLGRETYLLNLGDYQEQLGRKTEAAQSYQHVFDWPPAATSDYWQHTELRRQAAQTFLAATPPYPELYQQSKMHLAAGQQVEALQTIKQAILVTPAEFRPPYYTMWGELARQQGRPELAAGHYERAISTALSPRTDYANLIPQREPLATELPYCLLLPFPEDYLAYPSMALAELKLAAGDIKAAVAIYGRLLHYEPYNAAALQALEQVIANYPELELETSTQTRDGTTQ